MDRRTINFDLEILRQQPERSCTYRVLHMGVIGCTLSVGRKVKLEIPAQANPFVSPDPIPASCTREVYWSTDVSAPKPPHRSWVLPFASAAQMGETSP